MAERPRRCLGRSFPPVFQKPQLRHIPAIAGMWRNWIKKKIKEKMKKKNKGTYRKAEKPIKNIKNRSWSRPDLDQMSLGQTSTKLVEVGSWLS